MRFFKNMRSYHDHRGSKRRELTQHAHARGSHAFTYTLTSILLQPRCASASSAITLFGIEFHFEDTRGRGAKRSTWRKPLTACSLIGITYIRGENPTSRTGIEPSPFNNIGDKLAWPRARAAFDPLSYRQPLSDQRHIVYSCDRHNNYALV